MALVAYWISVALKIIVIILILYLLKKEYHFRTLKSKEENVRNLYQKLLDLWSIITMIFCIGMPFFSLLGSIIDTLCPFSFKIGYTFVANLPTLTVFYQTARLQYCFLQKQIHSQKYGYPQWLFIALYVYGISFSIYSNIILWFAYSGHWKNSMCFWFMNDQTNTNSFLGSIAFISFYIWDWFTLILYVLKIYQIKRKKQDLKDDNKQKPILRRVYMTLRKILFLTLLIEIMVISTLIFPSNHHNNDNINIYNELYPSIHSLGFALIMYLMIEHNRDKYITFTYYLYKSKVCCCCYCLIKDSAQLMEDNHRKEGIHQKDKHGNEGHKDDSIDTKDKSVKELHVNYVSRSELTETRD